jgi:S-methylmethionine-dependent homocysteine/selenocysteine methylase
MCSRRRGLGDRFEEFNRPAVELCRQAIAAAGAGVECGIAGSISNYAAASDRSKLPLVPRLRENYREQAELLADTGAYMFVLEMLTDVEVSLAAVEGAAATGLPVSIGFTCAFPTMVKPSAPVTG